LRFERPGESASDADRPRERAGWAVWFGRFAFSFLILGAVAAIEGWKAQQRGDDAARAMLLFALAAVGSALGFAAMRIRHRRR
jgi:hypothetical protein